MRKSTASKALRPIDDVVDELLVQLKDASEDLGDQAEATLARAATRLRAAAREFETEARIRAKAAGKEVAREVRAHPVAAAGIATAAAALIGLAIARNSKVA